MHNEQTLQNGSAALRVTYSVKYIKPKNVKNVIDGISGRQRGATDRMRNQPFEKRCHSCFTGLLLPNLWFMGHNTTVA
jgi:hypothetical protein